MLMLSVLYSDFYDLNLFSKWQVKMLLLSLPIALAFKKGTLANRIILLHVESLISLVFRIF